MPDSLHVTAQHELSKLNTDDLPVSFIKEYLNNSFVEFSTSNTFISKASKQSEYAHKIKTAHQLLDKLCDYIANQND